MVRLLPRLLANQRSGIFRFNPTMVRLLPSPLPGPRRCDIWFQSHNGAIAALTVKDQRIPVAMFQSHNGAIAANRHTPNIVYDGKVSIPQWCDCCRRCLK